MNDPFNLASRLRAHASCNLEVHGVFIDCLDCNVGIVEAAPLDDGTGREYVHKFQGHDGHECEIAFYGSEEDPVDITVECCNTVLVSAETDGEFQCPKCGDSFPGTDFSEHTVISDHGCCYACHKKWQHGEQE